MPADPPVIRECPRCLMAVKFPQVLSGSLEGVTFWTDGKMAGPRLPEEPKIVKCPFCGEFVWAAQAEELGQARSTHDHPEWPEARWIDDLDESDCYRALDAGIANTRRRERYLRIHAWHLSNARWRQGEHGVQPRIERETAASANLLALELLLDEEDPDDRLMKAEIARELGRFAEVPRLLDHPFTLAEHVAVARRIGELATAGDALVRQVDFAGF